MVKITYKTEFKGRKPYPRKEKDDYLSYLESHKDDLYYGTVGVYLAREVNYNNQKLYFPFIDIDGDTKLQGAEKIESAIHNTDLTLRIFRELGVDQRFTVIATGNTGFRIASNILLDKDSYLAFVDFVKYEMTDIKDTGPTEDIEMPHQLFVYKNSDKHTKILVDGHSEVVPLQLFENDSVTVDYYKEITEGKLNPETVIDFMRKFLNFTPITDLHVLGELGKKLLEYKQVRKDTKVNSFNLERLRKRDTSISLEMMHKKLMENGIYCKIKQHGKNAISFQELPCPACGRTTSNAFAYPPHYTLRCRSSNCPAYHKDGGMPLSKWAKFTKGQDQSINYRYKTKNLFHEKPTSSHTIEKSRDRIREELENDDNSLLLITPGVGKTYTTLEHLAKTIGDKVVFYSCFSKDLKNEVYEQYKRFYELSSNIYYLRPRDELCCKKTELNEITMQGFSPGEIICPDCENRDECEYYKQRENMSGGIYFVTHHMLRYLEKKLPDPDLIVLDENFVGSFLNNDECTESQMRTLGIVLAPVDYSLIDKMLQIGQNLAIQVMREQKRRALLINAKKMTGGNMPEDSICSILAIQYDTTESDIDYRIKRLLIKIGKLSNKGLYKMGVNLRAVNWIRGLVSRKYYSYLLINSNGDIKFNVKYKTPLAYNNTPIKILDATGNEKVAQSLTHRLFKTVKLDVEWKSKRIHIKTNTSRGVLRRAKDKNLRSLLETALNEISAKSVMVVTYKFLKNRILEVCKEIDPSRTYMVNHFIGPRGVNEYKECDGVIVLGLPFPNINSGWQDAHILFHNDDDDTKDYWVYSSMMWELYQNIHRIRPVNKNGVEIVIIANHWPSIIPEPDKEIDQSKSAHWMDLAIQRLEPYVNEFGFLNSDIGFLANVFVKAKESTAREFRRKIDIVTKAYLYGLKSNEVNLKNRTLMKIKEMTTYNNFMKITQRMKLINVLYNLYYKNLLKHENHLTLKLFNLIPSDQGILDVNPIKISNTKQWTDILNYFKDRFQHFESFKLKLPHARGNYVGGVGNIKQVDNFYDNLSNLKLFETINLETYKTVSESTTSIDPIPDGYTIVYIPDDNSKLFYIGEKNQVTPVLFKTELSKLEELLNDVKTKIITNNGKSLAKQFIQSGINPCDIHDISINEKLIKNGEEVPKTIELKYLFRQYGLLEDVDVTMTVSQLYKVWNAQQKLIVKFNIRNIVNLENQIIWITAQQELTGIGIDANGMLEYLELIKSDPKRKSDYHMIGHCISRIGDDERIHDTVNQLGTKTGRFYCELQKVRKEGPMRSFFKAQDGYKFIIADYSQLEPRIIASLANDARARKVFEEDRDLYMDVADTISREENTRFRNIFKTIVLGLNYGMGSWSIQKGLEEKGISITENEVKELIVKYKEHYPDIFKWREQTVVEARRQGYIKTSLGRRMKVSEDTKDTSLYNYPVQATAADGFKQALIKLYRKLEGLDAKIVHTLHDEIIVEVNEEIAEKVKITMEDCMIEAFEKLELDIPFKVKTKIQKTWQK